MGRYCSTVCSSRDNDFFTVSLAISIAVHRAVVPIGSPPRIITLARRVRYQPHSLTQLRVIPSSTVLLTTAPGRRANRVPPRPLPFIVDDMRHSPRSPLMRAIGFAAAVALCARAGNGLQPLADHQPAADNATILQVRRIIFCSDRGEFRRRE